MKACGAKSPICGCVDYYADFDGTCKCENGKVSMDLVIEYNPKALYILKTWWGPRGLIRAHERGHLSDHMRVLNEQRVDGERLEADEYGSVPECEAKKNAWREAGFAKLKSAAFSQDKMTVKGRLCFPGLF
jgi:hypothetical protein